MTLLVVTVWQIYDWQRFLKLRGFFRTVMAATESKSA